MPKVLDFISGVVCLDKNYWEVCVDGCCHYRGLGALFDSVLWSGGPRI
jgi:hypothetical protein